MGQTLTHGIYLPDEGERNCYNGLAANWSILDGAVGTIAEHTTALSGKAPLVHTHSKADITDFPVYGTTAGTICEGNDSRLSDARTPVAHTHGKSDVTDLLNSNFIPSANNSYDLGSSSYQWNKIYSADVVHTSGGETINGVKTLIDYWHLQAKNLKAGEGETYGRTGYSFIYTDKNDATMGDVTLFKNSGAARTFIRIRGGDYYTNGAPAAGGTLVQSTLIVGTNGSGTKIIECDSDIVYPTTDNTTDLGDSTHRWKTLNGINPGALSLPDSSNGISVDTTGWSLTGARNSYTPSANGWFFIRVEGTGVCKLNIHLRSPDNDYPTWHSWNQDTYTVLTVPAIQGVKIYVYITADLIKYCKLYPCLGNV